MPAALSAPVMRHRLPAVRQITLDHPWRWLAAGWRDMVDAPGIGYAYGNFFAAMGFLLLAGLNAMEVGYLIAPLAMGFTLIAPVAAAGLYETSRRLETGETTGFAAAFGAIWRGRSQIGVVAGLVLIAFAAWMQLALLQFMLFFGSTPPAPDSVVAALFLSDQGPAFLLTGLLTGGLIAAGIFAAIAVAIPMLVAKPDTDAMTAMLTSFAACRRNPKPMMLWAGMIAALTMLGLGLFFIGLVIVLPLLGHASWHAYGDLVGE